MPFNESVEKFSRMVQQIGTATNEQSKTSTTIAKSTEQIAAMISSIKTSCDIQTKSTANITKAVSGIEQSTDKNLEAASLLDTAVTSLTEQTNVLQKEMGAFRLTREQSALADSEPSTSSGV